MVDRNEILKRFSKYIKCHDSISSICDSVWFELSGWQSELIYRLKVNALIVANLEDEMLTRLSHNVLKDKKKDLWSMPCLITVYSEDKNETRMWNDKLKWPWIFDDILLRLKVLETIFFVTMSLLVWNVWNLRSWSLWQVEFIVFLEWQQKWLDIAKICGNDENWRRRILPKEWSSFDRNLPTKSKQKFEIIFNFLFLDAQIFTYY